MAELHELGVRAAAAAIRGREIGSVELVQALLARIEATDERLQAWQALDAEGALAQARRCDEAAARGDGGPLNGVPLGIKDVYHVAGVAPPTAPSPSRRCLSTKRSGVPWTQRASRLWGT